MISVYIASEDKHVYKSDLYYAYSEIFSIYFNSFFVSEKKVNLTKTTN